MLDKYSPKSLTQEHWWYCKCPLGNGTWRESAAIQKETLIYVITLILLPTDTQHEGDCSLRWSYSYPPYLHDTKSYFICWFTSSICSVRYDFQRNKDEIASTLQTFALMKKERENTTVRAVNVSKAINGASGITHFLRAREAAARRPIISCFVRDPNRRVELGLNSVRNIFVKEMGFETGTQCLV